ncbi:transposase [Streptomyces lydicus]
MLYGGLGRGDTSTSSGCADCWPACRCRGSTAGAWCRRWTCRRGCVRTQPRSAERLFCHVYGRAKGDAQVIPGWLSPFVAALEPGATPGPRSWMLSGWDGWGPRGGRDRRPRGPVARRCPAPGRRRAVGGGGADVTIVADAGYDLPRLA